MQRYFNSLIILLLFSLFVGTVSLYGHGKKEHKKVDSMAAVSKDSTKEKDTATQAVAGKEEPFEFDVIEALSEHLHNRVIHLPVGLTLAAFVLSLVSLRWKDFQYGIPWLVLIAALSAIVAYFTGVYQSGVFEGGPKQWVVELHRKLGITTAVSLWVWTLFLFVRPLKPYALFAGILVVIVLLITGLYGGVLAHG